MDMLKNFLKYIPGFRSGEKVNMIIASIYYMSCILFLIIGLIFAKDVDRESCIGVSGGALLFPIFIFSVTNNINRML